MITGSSRHSAYNKRTNPPPIEKYQNASGMTYFFSPSDLIHWIINLIANKNCPPKPTMTIKVAGFSAIEAGRNGIAVCRKLPVVSADVPIIFEMISSI